jgi:hypothetical protein
MRVILASKAWLTTLQLLLNHMPPQQQLQILNLCCYNRRNGSRRNLRLLMIMMVMMNKQRNYTGLIMVLRLEITIKASPLHPMVKGR